MKIEKHEKTFQAECPNCKTINITNDVINKDQMDAELVFNCSKCSTEYKCNRYFSNINKSFKEIDK